MSQREQLLAAAVLSLFVLWGGGKLWGRYNDSISSQRTALIAAQSRLDDAKLALERGRLAVKQLEAWQAQSLPADRDVAQTLYREWLRSKCSDAGVTLDDIQTDQRTTRTEAYTTIGYTITAHGSLKALTSLLYSFYKSSQLQQITRMQVRPGADTGQLSLTMTVEALVLPGSSNTAKLPDGVSTRLAKANADDYVKSITGRNLLTAYTPPRAEPPAGAAHVEPPKPKFDDAAYAFVTGIVEVDGRLQAWITVRTTAEELRVFAGDSVKVGQFEGKVVSIAPRMVVLQSDKEELHIGLGHSLREVAKPAADVPKG
jgi:Type II secretion system (T2SS), protein M subtype b